MLVTLPTKIKWFRRDAIGRLTSDLSLTADWGRGNLVLFNASKTQFLQLYTRHNLPDNYPLFFIVTQLILSSNKNTLGLSFIINLNLQLHISTLAKSASKMLGVLWRLRPFFSPSQLLTMYRGSIRLCMEEYGSHVWEDSFHTALLNWVESKAFRLINSPPLIDSFNTFSHRCNATSLSFFYCYFHVDLSSELANCMPPHLPPPRCTRLSTSHPYSVHLPNTRIGSIFSLSSLTLVNSGILFHCLFSHLPMT